MSTTELNDFVRDMVSDYIEHSKCIYHMMLEINNPEIIHGVLCSGRSIPVRSSYEWSLLDYYALGYCISLSECEWELNFMSISMGNEGMKMLCKGLMKNSETIRKGGGEIEAYFSGGKISLQGIEALNNVPRQVLRKIKVIHLHENRLDQRALDTFSDIISALSSLEVLGLSKNPIHKGGAVKLLTALHESKIPLKSLGLNNTGIDIEDTEVLSKLLANKDLEELFISGDVMSKMKDHIVNLKILYMSWSSLSDKNCTFLATFLQQPSAQLKELDICHCEITNKGAELLLGGMHTNKSVEKLNMGENDIGLEGARAAGDMLRHNTALRILYLTRCGIKADGCVLLIEGLTVNSSLHVLKLNGNEIGIKGAKAMSKMMAVNETIKELHVLNRDDSLKEGIHIIISSLEHNRSLQTLRFSKNYKQPGTDSRMIWL